MSDTPRTAVNQAPGGGTDYPFTGEGDLVGGVLDLYLSYPDPECAYVLPFTLTVSGDTFTVTDATAAVVVTADTIDAASRAWGTRTVYEWTVGPVLRVVVRDDLLVDGTGVLDLRTCNRLPARVTSYRVGLVSVSGNVKFEAGYNIDMSGAVPDDRPDGGRFVNQVNMDAAPGAGAGRLSGCDDIATLVRKINRAVPDCGGNFNIEVDPCLRGQLALFVDGGPDEPRAADYSEAGMTYAEAKAAIKLHSDCHPCCECDYFVRTYRGLKRMWGKWRDVAVKAETVRDMYEENRQRWLASRQCRFENPARLVVSTDGNCKTAVGGSYCNFTTCCVSPVELRFTMQKFEDGLPVDWTTGSAQNATISGSPTRGDEAYAPLVSGPVIRFFLDYADSQAMSVAKMKFCTTACTAEQTLQITMTAHVDQPPPHPQTGDTCEVPEAAVPAAILAIWAANDVPVGGTVRAVMEKTAALNPKKPTFDCGC